jgi:hypothetical protein
MTRLRETRSTLRLPTADYRVVSSSPPDHPGRRICCLLSVVSGIGQPIEIASQAVQPILDGSRCRPLGCLARFSSFPAIVLGRLRWRVCGLIHEPHMVGPPRRCDPRGGSHAQLGKQSSVGTRSVRWEITAFGCSRSISGNAALAADRPASPAGDRPACPGPATSPASRDSRERRPPARTAPERSVSHRTHSHRLTALPGARNRLLPPPRQASALLLGFQPALRQPGPTVPALRRSNEIGPHRAPWCRGRRNGYYNLD